MSLRSDLQKSFPGELVTLFQLDCSRIAAGPILYFTPSSSNNDAIQFDGQSYTPIDIEAEGFEWSGQGAFPTPTLRLSNVTQAATALVNTYQDLIGAEVRRIRTLSQYLDNGDTPDPGQIFSVDIFKVEQKTVHNRSIIEWKLSAAIDQQGSALPSQILVRDYCTRHYRVPDGSGDFDYSRVSCRYAGDNYFDAENNSTLDPNEDRCSHTLTGCKLRFGENAKLPFKGCPGMAKLR